jgi:cysteine desulfurase/selenocysteine lyase
MEHHSNIVPWQLLQKRKKIIIKVVPFDENGELMIEELEKLITPQTRLISCSHVSNALGTINPVKDIIRIAHDHDIPVLLDGAQSVPHISVDVQDLDVDFFAFSGHKIYGPTGIGVLYGKEAWLEKLPPYQGGGEMIESVSFEETTFNVLPYKFEAGTPDFIGSTALAEALKFTASIGRQNIAAHEYELLRYATQELSKFEEIRFIGQAKNKSGVISFLLGNVHPYDLGMILDKMGIAIRTGHHCAQPVMKAFNINGTARVSFALYNTKDEIDIFIESVQKAIKMLL